MSRDAERQEFSPGAMEARELEDRPRDERLADPNSLTQDPDAASNEEARNSGRAGSGRVLTTPSDNATTCPHPKDCAKNGCSGCCGQDPPICAKPELKMAR